MSTILRKRGLICQGAHAVKTISSRLLQSCQLTASYSSTPASNGDKVYEVRTYNVKPEGMKPFMDMCKKHFHQRMSYSKLVGFWSSEVGGINDVVHVWEYDSLSHRAFVRAALAEDTVYLTEFYSHILPLLLRMDNCLARCLPGTQVELPPATGVYELQQFCFPGQEPVAMVEHVRSMDKPGAKLIAGFYNIIGQLPGEMGTLLWYHPDADNILKSSPCQTQNVKIVQSRLLVAAPWSPMQ